MSLTVGDTGKFNTTGISIPNVTYTVMAVNTISNLVSLGMDVFAVAFETHGIDETVYTAYSGDIQVITLKDELGISLHVPEPNITVVSDAGFISYSGRALVINLGIWPERGFSSLQSSIVDLVEQRLGVTPTTKITDISRPRLVLLEDHDYIEFRRKNRQVQHIDPVVLLRKSNEALTAAQQKIKSYQTYITKYLKHCNKRCDEFEEPPLPVKSCNSILDKTFNIFCPCKPCRDYPPRPPVARKPLPHKPHANCGGLIAATFSTCNPCISPTTAYLCKSKVRYNPARKPTTYKPHANCGGLIAATFSTCNPCISPATAYLCKSKVPYRPARKPLPRRLHANCGGLIAATFSTCNPCISPTTAYLCKSKVRYNPTGKPTTYKTIPCDAMSAVPFTTSFKICPIAYHSSHSRCNK